MKLLILLMLLSGCTPHVIKPEFPPVPEELTVPCDKLTLIPEDTTKLSEMLNIIVDNYAAYSVCREKTAAWIDWYTSQKQNYQKIN